MMPFGTMAPMQFNPPQMKSNGLAGVGMNILSAALKGAGGAGGAGGGLLTGEGGLLGANPNIPSAGFDKEGKQFGTFGAAPPTGLLGQLLQGMRRQAPGPGGGMMPPMAPPMVAPPMGGVGY